ncbi:MAG: type II toxin-antitoxin system PemK/MazF family toxin [Anaerostipes sp.]|jgi:mRNA interferase MazF|nr:type II toxin-antitoxin system PemK/MazF family toxin [Anaerostipes sp.]MDD3745107.1 type II toxin-antitoxin system PemK/MazF family toxin [Anaerostipes sp.]
MKKKNYYAKYKRGQVVYVNFGLKPNGVQGFIRPAVVVSCNASNHNRAPQVTVCPLSSKLKDIKVHVKIKPLDVNGHHLKKISDCMPEDMQTVPKSAIMEHIGYITASSNIMEEIDKSLLSQLALWDTAKKLVREEILNGEGEKEKIS